MRVASSRFWMSLLSRSASSRTTPASDCRRSSSAIAGALRKTVAAPRIEASGVRNSCDTEPISASRRSSVSERILASLRARATSRRSSVAAASDSTSSTRWRMSATALLGHAAEVDGDHAEVGRSLRDAADQPDVAGAVVDRGRQRRAALDLGDRRAHGARARRAFVRGRRRRGRRRTAPPCAGPGWRDAPRSRDRCRPPSAPPRAAARRRRDRSSRFRACGRARSAASSSWRDGWSPPRRS